MFFAFIYWCGNACVLVHSLGHWVLLFWYASALVPFWMVTFCTCLRTTRDIVSHYSVYQLCLHVAHVIALDALPIVVLHVGLSCLHLPAACANYEYMHALFVGCFSYWVLIVCKVLALVLCVGLPPWLLDSDYFHAL